MYMLNILNMSLYLRRFMIQRAFGILYYLSADVLEVPFFLLKPYCNKTSFYHGRSGTPFGK